MKIIIVGAGRIGRNLAKTLSEEENEIYLIESKEDLGRTFAEKIDGKVIVGNGADPDVLQKANVENADLVLAVTTSDETNLVVCSLAGALGAKRRIARVRSTSLRTILVEKGYSRFHIDEIINPELLAAEDIVRTIETPGASEVAQFADGKVLLRGFDVPASSPLVGQKIVDFADEDFPWPFVIVSVVRDEKVIIPTGDFLIEEKDHIYVLLPAPSLAEFLTFVDPNIKMVKKVVIYGATITGKHVAAALSRKISNVVLLEENSETAKSIAGEMDNVTIIHGTASESDILAECGIEAADAFIAVTGSDRTNLISSVLAKKMGAKITIISTQQPDYMQLSGVLDIDAIINPHHLAVKQILHLVRGRGVSSVIKLEDGEAETLELVPEAGSPVTKDVIRNVKFPKNSIVGAVYSGSEVKLAKGDTQIREGHKVIVFCHQSAVKKIQDLFTR